ncbi:unnamed protein product [Musa textilis]
MAITLSPQNRSSRVRSGTTHMRRTLVTRTSIGTGLRERIPPNAAGAPHPAQWTPEPLDSRWALMSHHQTGQLGCAAPMLIRLKISHFLTNVGLNAPCLPALGAHPLLGCTT